MRERESERDSKKRERAKKRERERLLFKQNLVNVCFSILWLANSAADMEQKPGTYTDPKQRQVQYFVDNTGHLLAGKEHPQT